MFWFSLSVLYSLSPIVRRQHGCLSVSWGIFIRPFYCLRRWRVGGVLADLWLWTLNGTSAFTPEPILDLARVTAQGGGLMAHFARHTELLGPHRPPCCLSTPPPHSRGKHTHTHTNVLYVRLTQAHNQNWRGRGGIAQHSCWGLKTSPQQISGSWCNITLLLFLLWCRKKWRLQAGGRIQHNRDWLLTS